MSRGIHHQPTGHGKPALPPLAGMAFLTETSPCTDDFTIGIRRGDDVAYHVTLNLPPEWSLPGDPAGEVDLRIDTRSSSVWFRPSADDGTAAGQLARVIANDDDVCAAAELNGCPAIVLAAMIAALVIYAETEAAVRVQIDGDRNQAQLWASFAVIIYNWHRRTA